MSGAKRKHADEDFDIDAGADGVHPARKQRLDDGTADAELRKIFNELREEIQSTRLEATRKLLKILSVKSDKQTRNLDYSITRLIKGVCSGAKAARPGFSIALVEVLRLGFASDLKIVNVVDKIIALTNPESKASGDEKRSYLLGRRFALQAVLQSGILGKASNEDEKYVFDAIAELAAQKPWLRSESGAMLYEFLKSPEGNQLSENTARYLLDSWAAKGLLKSPEGIALWLTTKKTFASVKLPKGVWHHNNPLSSQERPTVTKILLKNAVEGDEEPNGALKKKKASGSRQVTPSFAWQVILNHLYGESGGQKFSAFWEECVAQQMFSSSSSTERKSLGLQIFTQALITSPLDLLGEVIHINIIRCVTDQRAKSDRYLYEAAKTPLNAMVKRAKVESAASSVLLCRLLTVLPPNVDNLTKTTIESLLSTVDLGGLGDIVATAVELCRIPGCDSSANADKKRRMLADILLNAVRTRRSNGAQYLAEDGEDNLSDWLLTLLRSFTHLGYTTPLEKCSPALSDTSRTLFRERLISTLGHLLDLPMQQAAAAPSLVVETLHESKKSLLDELDEKSTTVLKDARKQLKDAAKKAKASTGGTLTMMRAFQLLLSLAMLQVYRQEPDSLGVLEDVISCYHMPKTDGDASTMIVELLLSFISKPSALFRKLAEQVFSAFAPEVTPEGLQSMIDILSQKETLAGQQELFKDDEEEVQDQDNDSEDAMDVEDASDMELVNGEVNGRDATDDSDVSDSSENEDNSSSSIDNNTEDEDEEAAFDRKLADALGTTGMEADDASRSDSDGSDMDDDQMMALEPHLTNIFKERKKTSSKKQDNKDAKENMINFKNRVLDLLLVYVKSQYANTLALDLIHPLITLTRTTSNPPTTKKAMDVLETLFDTAKKHKTLPKLPNPEAGFELLSAIHAEMRLGGSKIHANACSRASQFLAKILVGMDTKHWKQIAEMYIVLQDEWRRDVKSKIHGSVFNDWHSWSMQR